MHQNSPNPIKHLRFLRTHLNDRISKSTPNIQPPLTKRLPNDMEGHSEPYVFYFSIYPATCKYSGSRPLSMDRMVGSPHQSFLVTQRIFKLNSNSPSPLAMPGVQSASQGPLHEEETLRPDARATYPTSHSDDAPWDDVNAVNNHEAHPSVVTDPIAQPASLPAFANLSMLNYHQGIVSTSNQPQTPAGGLAGSGQSTVSASVPAHGIPAAAGGHRFECEDCHKVFDRPSRLDNCRNRHLGIKPWQCEGRCEDSTWFVILPHSVTLSV
jgi:hypothetical protein